MTKLQLPNFTQLLQTHFNFSNFRSGQLEALTLLATQGKLLCIQPTGYGKSLLYQLTALTLDGITLVISPLLALMRDQLKQLKERFNIPAASLNTDQSDEENFAALKAIRNGQIKILFIAPEQLDHLQRFEFLLELPIQLLVVDEAHCISTWGHDFRPSYRHIIHLSHQLLANNAKLKLLALTATANKKTEEDIKLQFNIDDQPMIVHRESMNRPNIRLSVIRLNGIAEKLSVLTHLLSHLNGSGLIYCATRENTELVADYLIAQGIKAVAFHAGLEAHRKIVIQNDFIRDEYPVIAATNALGMGIDKANLRYIIHFDFPGSITAYYQEVGRSGRDGLPADGILLYDPIDSNIQNHFIESAQPHIQDFELVLQTMTRVKSPPNLTFLKRDTGMHPTKLNVVLAELIEQGYLKKVMHQGLQTYQLIQKSGMPKLTRYKTQYRVKQQELLAIKDYAEANRCYMATLRITLGDDAVEACGHCHVCAPIPFLNDEPVMGLKLASASWLERRTIPIVLSKKIKNVVTGMAVLDGKLRSADFIYFMRERARNHSELGLTHSLFELIKECLREIQKYHPMSCIVPLPSRTWVARDSIVNRLAQFLQVPAKLDLIRWQTVPDARQGELLNNDQRLHNVSQRMCINTLETLPQGNILLFDDYMGSGATLNEAARVLQDGLPCTVIPFTVAAVKWRLGKRGMI